LTEAKQTSERSVLDGEPGWSLALQVRVADGHLIEAQCLYCGEVWSVSRLTFADLGRAFSPTACPNADDDNHGPPRAGFRPYSEPYTGS
jgi:hypothetical protein